MTVITIADDMFYECPLCGNDEVELGQNYCQDCGEVFDWKIEY